MLKNIKDFFRKFGKKQERLNKESAKERLHLVLLQDRANVSADFLDMMKQEIIEVIKKYIDIDEKEIDVKLTNKQNSDGTTGAPALYANIPIVGIKSETRKMTNKIKLEEADKNVNKENNKVKKDKNKVDEKNAKVKENQKETSKEESKKDNKESKEKEVKKDTKKENAKVEDKKDSKDNKNKESKVKEKANSSTKKK